MYGKKVRLLTAEEAAGLVQSNQTIAVAGFVGTGHPEALTSALEKRFLHEKAPMGLSLVCATGQGDGSGRGLDHLAHEGLLKRVISGHFVAMPAVTKLAVQGKIEAYNFPQGVIAHLFRDIAAGKPGTLTQVGLHTFVDPRHSGGKLNEATAEELVDRVELAGEDFLLYKSFPVDVAFLRGTTADEYGNVSMEKEAITLETFAAAQAARNSGGIVIVQVERLAVGGSLDPQQVVLPNVLVDAVVVAESEHHPQSFTERFNPSYTGQIREVRDRLEPLRLDERKMIARRAIRELAAGDVVNLGIGIPEGIGYVASEEGRTDFTLVLDSGPIGGIPAKGFSFGASTNPYAVLDMPSAFDFIDGGGIDTAFLGMAEADPQGNVNVSKYGGSITGCGGFINISHNAKKVVFCSTFTAGGLRVQAADGKLCIVQEGRHRKFVDRIGHLTFNAAYASQKGITVLYVTERAVFRIVPDGLELTEIAPGIDLEKDVLAQMGFRPSISPELRLMDESIFR
ncbi:acyl CoA:acetate/3-ketoacid CoA transferase [Paenibacillus sp. MBLB4367]|uniref:acyl CoA:acetate/3-ketoacid CoA transferase n=1 Tax=Paenibacillus sp. MBLB4367 TaxID=3384767 RepID=UPI0039081AD6